MPIYHEDVAVSTGLLQRMDQNEVEAVLGHEISHVANGDMVTLTLIQGVVNTFVIFLARIIGNLVDRVVFRSEDGRGPAEYGELVEAASANPAERTRRPNGAADSGAARRG